MLCVDENIFKSINSNYSNDISYEQFAEKHHIANYVVSNKESDTINRCIYVKKQERLYHMFKVVSSIINDVAIEYDIEKAWNVLHYVYESRKRYEDDGK